MKNADQILRRHPRSEWAPSSLPFGLFRDFTVRREDLALESGSQWYLNVVSSCGTVVIYNETGRLLCDSQCMASLSVGTH